MLTLYGISNCDTVRKARRWLDENNHPYQFHDFRKQGVTTELISNLEARLGWEIMLNKRSTSWKKVDEELRNNINQDIAIQLMTETPTLIKRPILESGDFVMAGFKAENYQEKL